MASCASDEELEENAVHGTCYYSLVQNIASTSNVCRDA
jgi:hypothetical protein